MRILRSLEVFLAGQRVGQLERNRDGLTRWLPDQAWEQGGQRPRLGLHFLRSPGPQQVGTGLPVWFENLLPEAGSALRVRLARLHGVRPSDGFGLLAMLGRDLPGAVQIHPAGGQGEPAASHSSADLSDRGVTEDDEAPMAVPADALRESVGETAVERVRARQSEWEVAGPEVSAARFRFSLAGMQLKLSMTAQGPRFAMSSRSGEGHWIVKLPDLLHLDLPEIEAATMRWARAAGHAVPRNFVFDASLIDGLSPGWTDSIPRAYAIERFDRRPNGLRVHHEDFCQALDLLPEHKYGDSGSQKIGLDGVLRMVADVAGEEQAREFSRRVGFVIGAGNDDAHLKNWSFAWGGAERPALSPCYDQVATVAWPEKHGWKSHRKGPALSLALGRVRRFHDLDYAALDRHAASSGQSWAREMVMEGIARARAAWPAVEDGVPEGMRRALRSHWRKVPVLVKAGNLPEKPAVFPLPAPPAVELAPTLPRSEPAQTGLNKANGADSEDSAPRADQRTMRPASV